MKNLLVTGAAGYIGQKFLRRIAGLRRTPVVACVDVREPDFLPPNGAFYRRDVREPLDDILIRHSIAAVVHAAFIIPPLHDTRLMEDVNINGTRSVMESCVRAGVRHVLYTSSATAYGFHADNDAPLTEESPLRGNDDITYSKSKRIIEGMMAGYACDNPRVAFTVLRPCFVVGPGFDNPLARHLRKRVVPLIRATSPMQFVHEDDLIDIMLICLERRKKGIFNVAGDGVMDAGDMARMLGNVPVRLPYGFMYAANAAAWALRLRFISEFPSPFLKMIRHPWIVSTAKMKRELKYSCRYTTRQAFENFALHVRGEASSRPHGPAGK